MLVDVIDSPAALEKLKGNWNDLYDLDPEAHFYISWTWISNWFDRLDVPWLVLAAKPKGHAKYVAFFPLHVRTEKNARGACHTVLRTGGSPLAGMTGVVCDPKYARDAIGAFSQRLDELNWASVQLDTFAVSQTRQAWLRTRFERADIIRRGVVIGVRNDPTDYGVYPFVRLPKDFGSFIAGLGPVTRRNARAYFRQVEAGELRITDANEETFERDLDILLRFWEMRWGRRRQAERNNYGKMLWRCFRDGCAFLPVLWRGDTPIGAQGRLIDRSKRTLVCLVGARDITVKRPSPGFILHLHCIRWAIENGFAVYDLQLGNHKHKYAFHPEERRIRGFWLEKTDQQSTGLLDKRSIPTLLQRAKQSYSDGKCADAARISSQILELDPGHAAARDLLFELNSAAAFRETRAPGTQTRQPPAEKFEKPHQSLKLG